MNVALGTIGLGIGLAACVVGIGALVVGLARRNGALLELSRYFAIAAFVGAASAFAAMENALITRDFTVRYVAEHGSSRTPALFNFAALWSSLEGSILLWTLILAGFVALTALVFRKRLSDPLVGWAMLTLFIVTIFFFALMIGPANPFRPFNPPPGFDGAGPNPLLQNHILMALHPPVLYVGLVGFVVPFAFALGALVTGRLDKAWLLATRRWTLIAWGFLTLGIVLGAWWSYEVLGWGGFWAWDPVENASLLPWLTGTAYLHSVMVQERTAMLRVWNLSLLCATFALTILGTFFTRSGVLESVHAFANTTIGPTLLGFFGVIVAVSIGLIAWRGGELASPGRIERPVSRQGALLANNLLFAVFAGVVLVGTTFPLVVEALRGDTVTVGEPYFNRMTGPIALSLLFLMAVAPALPWRRVAGELLRHRLYYPAWAGVGAIVAAVVVGANGLYPLLAFGLGGFAAGVAVRGLVLSVRRHGPRGLVGRSGGGMVVHIGVVLIAVAFAASSSYSRQGEFELEPGATAMLAGHEITYVGMDIVTHPEKVELRATVLVDGSEYRPTQSRFLVSGQAIGTPSVRVSVVDDVYVSLTDLGDDGGEAIRLRVVVQPLIVWLWIGGVVMALGTLLALIPTRVRKRRPPQAPVGSHEDTVTYTEKAMVSVS